MRALVISGILFLLVVTLVFVDGYILFHLVKEVDDLLDELPKNLSNNDVLGENIKIDVMNVLDSIEKKWKKSQTLLCLSLKHTVSRDFYNKIITAKSYFLTEEYTEFSACIVASRDILENIKYDEGIKLGNIL